MAQLLPVEQDPFAAVPPGYTAAEAAVQPKMTPVDHDPFAGGGGHPTSGPTDSLWTDIPRRVGSAVVNAGVGLLSPLAGAGGVGATIGADGKPSVGYQPPSDPAAAMRAMKDRGFNTAGATEYIPSTEAGRVTQAAGEGLVSSLLGGGALPMAAGSAAAQLLVDKTPLPPLAAALIGQIGGAHATRAATNAAAPMMPGTLDPETRALARTAVNDYRITVPMAKASNSPFVRYLDSTMRRMPLSGYGAADEANQTAYNQAINSTFGESAGKVTPDVLNAAYNRIGGVMNDIGRRTAVVLDQPLLNRLAALHTTAAEVGLDEGQANAVRRQIDKIQDIAAANNGSIPGDIYQNLTKRGESLDVLQGNRSTTAGRLGGQIRDALDEALERSAAPEDAAALRQARTQYKALKTVEPLTMRADTPGGPTPSTGDVSPAAVLSRVSQQYNNAPRAALGDIPLKDLGQIGQRFLKEPGSSGTAERGNIMHLLELGGGALGGVMGAEHYGGVSPLKTVPPLVAALVGPRMIGSILRSPSSISNAVNGAPLSPLALALASEMRTQPMAQGGGQ